MLSPITSQRPDSFQISAGCSAGRKNSWAPSASISCRTMASILASERRASGR